MADVYQFSASSMELVDRCRNITTMCGVTENKWKQLFEKVENPSESVVNVEPDDYDAVESIRIVLEKVRDNKFDVLTERCETTYLMHEVFEKLSDECRMKILEDLYDSKESDIDSVEKFFRLFFSVSNINRLDPIVTVESLSKAHKTYPSLVLSLVQTHLTDADMPSEILEIILKTADIDHSDILQGLSAKGIPMQAFIRHLNIIYLLYNNSEKTCDIQNLILDGLMQSARRCTEDTHFGRFLLMFCESLQKADATVDKTLLERLLDSHETYFKRLCFKIFDTLRED